MSGIRSADLKAPVTKRRSRPTALLVCTHGGVGIEATFRGFDAAAIASRAGFGRMAVCSLYGAPSLEKSAALLNGFDTTVVPYFLCEGVTLNALRSRIDHLSNRARITVCPIPGRHASLPQRLAKFAVASSKECRWAPHETGLLLVGHGSKRSNGSKRTIDAMGKAIAREGVFEDVGCAYLEEAPSVWDSLQGIRSRQLITVGCFMEAGFHAMQDVPRLLAEEARPTRYLGAIGQTAWMYRLAAEQAAGSVGSVKELCFVSSA